MILDPFEITAAQSGPTLVFTGAVHGNEPAGAVALGTLRAKADGGMTINRGRVLGVPVCNPQAFEQNVRQIDRNLNRLLFPKEHPVAYEDRIDNELCPILEQADYHVCLHTFTDPGTPYVLTGDPTPQDIAFAMSLGLEHMIYNWAGAYQESGGALDPLEQQGTTEYARLNGRAIALTVECGQHSDPKSADVAKMIVDNAMKYLGMIDGAPTPHPRPQLHKITRTYFKKKPGDFVKNWRNLEPIQKGEVLTRYEDGETILAPADGHILLTKPWAKVGGEWFCVSEPKPLPV